MQTLHTIKNCNYRKFLHKLMKHGRISGKFYKFLCRNFPYRLTYRGVTANVGEVINGRSKEDWVMQIMRTNEDHKLEIKHQKRMMKANIECGEKTKKFTTIEDVGRDIAGRRTTPYTKPLRRGNICREDPLYEFNR